MKFSVIKAGLMALLLGLLSACANNGVSTSSTGLASNDQVKELKQKRSGLQLEFSQLTQAWWQRAGQLAQTSSDLPLISNDANTLKQINRVLEQKNHELKQKIAQLDAKVSARKQGLLAGTRLALKLKYAGYKAAQQDKAQAVASNQIDLVQGETVFWSLYSKRGAPLPSMKVTLSEKNDLFIEGQLIAQLDANIETPAFITSVTLYGQQIYALGKLDMMLEPHITD